MPSFPKSTPATVKISPSSAQPSGAFTSHKSLKPEDRPESFLVYLNMPEGMKSQLPQDRPESGVYFS